MALTMLHLLLKALTQVCRISGSALIHTSYLGGIHIPGLSISVICMTCHSGLGSWAIFWIFLFLLCIVLQHFSTEICITASCFLGWHFVVRFFLNLNCFKTTVSRRVLYKCISGISWFHSVCSRQQWFSTYHISKTSSAVWVCFWKDLLGRSEGIVGYFYEFKLPKV